MSRMFMRARARANQDWSPFKKSIFPDFFVAYTFDGEIYVLIFVNMLIKCYLYTDPVHTWLFSPMYKDFYISNIVYWKLV